MTQSFKFDSSSSDKVYTTVIANDGRLGCDCKGWTIYKNRTRECKHTKEVVRRERLTVETRGEYLYVVRGTTPAPKPVEATSTVDRFPMAGPQKAEKADVARAELKAVKPMLACTIDSADIVDWTEWAIEEKFDGHRAIVMVSAGEVTAWSRSGKSRELPPQVEGAFASMPNGVYDGELMGKEGGTFADVRRLESQDEAYFVVFDIINALGENVMGQPYGDRRELLGRVFEANYFPRGDARRDGVRIAESVNLTSQEDVVEFVGKVWDRGGEGAILKRRAARYQAGKRSKDFIKVKKGGTTVCTVVGFEAGTLGPRSVVALRADDNGVETTVKAKNNKELAYVHAQGDALLGRKLRIEYTSRTGDAFTNPRWDRWENE